MRNVIPTAFAALLVVACATSTPEQVAARQQATASEPEIEIAQTSTMPAAAEHVTGGIPIHYAMRVTNRATEPITLKQVSLQSIGFGGYNVGATQHPFDQRIEPAQSITVSFWVPASADDSLAGTNGPVTLRLTTLFASAGKGQFQLTSIQQVSGGLGVR